MTQPVEMTASDCEDVLAFWRDMPGVGLSEGDTPDELAAYLERNPGLSLVVRREGRVFAAVLCGHDGRRGYLHHLAVAADARGQGLGKLLVDRCLAKLGALGIAKCSLFVYADNEDGSRFWAKNGWYDRTDLKVMQCRIPSARKPGGGKHESGRFLIRPYQRSAYCSVQSVSESLSLMNSRFPETTG